MIMAVLEIVGHLLSAISGVVRLELPAYQAVIVGRIRNCWWYSYGIPAAITHSYLKVLASFLRLNCFVAAAGGGGVANESKKAAAEHSGEIDVVVTVLVAVLVCVDECDGLGRSWMVIKGGLILFASPFLFLADGFFPAVEERLVATR